MFCSRCGTQRTGGQETFCVACGTPFAVASSTDAGVPTPPGPPAAERLLVAETVRLSAAEQAGPPPAFTGFGEGAAGTAAAPAIGYSRSRRQPLSPAFVVVSLFLVIAGFAVGYLLVTLAIPG